MKKSILISGIALLAFSIQTNAQVGINTTNPNATFDITAKNTTGTSANVDGLLIPRVDRQRAQSMASVSTSTLIYINSIATGSQTGTAVNIDATGYYYYNGTAWVKLNPSAPAVTNIYNTDGTLNGNRTVTQGTNTLAFKASSVNAFSVNNALSVDAANNRVGIGTSTPARILEVNAGNAPLRTTNLPILPSSTTSQALVIDNNGDIYKTTTENVAGQFIRIGLNYTSYPADSESALRFNLENSDAEMGNAPNGARNFFNSIIGSSFTESTSLPGGAGSPSRTTDRINLPAGQYRITIKLVGSFSNAEGNSVSLKTIINNNEYNFSNGVLTTASTATATGITTDIINLQSAQSLDFTILCKSSSFYILNYGSPGTGNSYRSIILIERVR